MNATASIRSLVGTPYIYGSGDPAFGLDCLTLCAEVWRILGEASGDPAAWRFPMPRDYRPDMIPVDELLDWHGNWIEAVPDLGAIVLMGAGHLGVQIEPGPAGAVIHARESTGVVIQRQRVLRPFIAGYFRLRRPEDGPAEDPPWVVRLMAQEAPPR